METIQELINNYFIKMCEQGNLPQVQHWLENGDSQLKADINCESDCAIISACCMGHLEVVKYLLTSTSLKKHSNIHAERDMAFRFSFATYSSNNSRTKRVIEYLILDYGIKLTDSIQKELTLYPNKEVEQLFRKRSFHHSVLKNKPHLYIVQK